MHWTTAITATESREKGGDGKNERGGPPQHLKCVDAHMLPKVMLLTNRPTMIARLWL